MEMKADESICITIKPEGGQEQVKCFEKGVEAYQEIRSKIKDMKPGEIRKVEEIDC